MKQNSKLHDRINRVINTAAFEPALEKGGLDLFEFQCDWYKLSGGEFEKLPSTYQNAILAGEAEIKGQGEKEVELV